MSNFSRKRVKELKAKAEAGTLTEDEWLEHQSYINEHGLSKATNKQHFKGVTVSLLIFILVVGGEMTKVMVRLDTQRRQEEQLKQVQEQLETSYNLIEETREEPLSLEELKARAQVIREADEARPRSEEQLALKAEIERLKDAWADKVNLLIEADIAYAENGAFDKDYIDALESLKAESEEEMVQPLLEVHEALDTFIASYITYVLEGNEVDEAKLDEINTKLKELKADFVRKIVDINRMNDL